MSQNNFVIQDIVSHVYCEDDYRSPKIARNAFRKLLSKSWIFLIILGISAGVGYVAVYLPDAVARKAEEISSMGGVEGLSSDLESLSDEQKRELLKQFQGQR